MPKATVGDSSLYYEVHGDGPPLVLVNGLGLEVGSWAPQVSVLSRRFRVVNFDNRGAGRSEAPPGPYSTAQMAGDTIRLLDLLGLDRVHVLGLSLGGFIAQELALQHPQRVKSLVLAATAARPPPRARHVIDLWRRMALAGVDREIILREQFAWSFTDKLLEEPSFVSDLVEMLVEHPYRPPPQGIAGQAAACLAHDSGPHLGRIAAPTLVLVGREDLVYPPRVAEQFAKAIPGARLAVLDGGGHAFASEIPPRFNETVLEFLQSVEGGPPASG